MLHRLMISMLNDTAFDFFRASTIHTLGAAEFSLLHTLANGAGDIDAAARLIDSRLHRSQTECFDTALIALRHFRY